MRKRLLSLLLIGALILLGTPSAHALPSATDTPLTLSAHSAVLADGEGNPLLEKNAEERMGPASTTKILTALVVAKSCDPRAEVSIPREAVGVEGSSILRQ